MLWNSNNKSTRRYLAIILAYLIKVRKSVFIPEGSYWGILNNGTVNNVKINIYEVWYSDEDVTGNVYSNDNRP